MNEVTKKDNILMGKYLDFEKEEKGYEIFQLTSENIKRNKGSRICYVNRVDARGQYFVRYAIIHSKRYSQLIVDDGDDSIDLRDIKECGIRIEDHKKP